MDIEVTRDALATARTVDTAAVEPSDGEAVFRIDSFALTANNVTYGAVGDLVGYWNFYPASEDGWGRIPVWGFADVAASRAEGVDVGDRYFGFWPMSTEAVLRPGSIGPTGFTDVTPHRVALPSIYNRYAKTPAGADEHAEALTSLLRPLFATSFLIDAWLADEDIFGAESVVISSASSKTALGLAYLLKSNARATVVGLTSPSNVGFVEDTGAYDRDRALRRPAARARRRAPRSTSTSPAVPTCSARSIATSATASGAASRSGSRTAPPATTRRFPVPRRSSSSLPTTSCAARSSGAVTAWPSGSTPPASVSTPRRARPSRSCTGPVPTRSSTPGPRPWTGASILATASSAAGEEDR